MSTIYLTLLRKIHFINIISNSSISRQCQKMKAELQQKTLIHQNLCLSSRLAQYKSEISSLKTELQELKKIKGVTLSIRNQKKSRLNINITHTADKEPMQEEKDEPSNSKVFQDLIEKLTSQNSLLRQRLTLLNDYQTEAIDKVIKNEQHLCFCGGLKISYYSSRIQDLIQLQKDKEEIKVEHQAESVISNIGEEIMKKQEALQNSDKELRIQNNILAEKLQRCQKKLQECRIRHKFNLDHLLQTPAYRQLKKTCQNLLIFCSQLIAKQKYLATQFQTAEKDKEKFIREMISRFEGQEQKGKTINYINLPQKLTLTQKLQKEKEKYKNIEGILNELGSKMKQIIGYYKNPQYTFKSICQKTQEKLKKNSSFIYTTNVQSAISQWLNHHSFEEYCKNSGTNLEQLKRDWNSYVRKIEILIIDNQEFKNQIYYEQRLLEKQQTIKGIKEDLEEMKEQIRSLEYTMKIIREEIIDAQFRVSSNFNQEHFKYKRENIKRQQLQKHLQQLHNQIPQCKQMISEGLNITNLIETEKLNAKQQEGLYLGQIKTVKSELEEKRKLITILENDVKKNIEEKNKVKIQNQKLKLLLYNTTNEKQSEVCAQLKMQIEAILKKITCSCGRGNEATVVLPCKHIICKPCVEGMQKARKRECPFCRARFDASHMVHFHYN